MAKPKPRIRQMFRRMSIPDELARREERLRKIAEARAKIEARPGSVTRVSWPSMKQTRGARGQDRGDGQEAWRQAPQPPTEDAAERSDQSHDEESRIMPAAGGGFEQCYNAQAAVRREACW